MTGKSISVNWSDLSLSEARGILTGYELSWAVASEYSAISLGIDSNYLINDDQLVVDKPYNIRVRGKNSVGFGDYSEVYIAPSKHHDHHFNL